MTKERRLSIVAALMSVGMITGCSAEPQVSAPAAVNEVTQGKEAMTEVQEYIDGLVSSGEIDKSKSSWKTNLPKFKELSFDADKSYFWVIETSKGTMKLKLFTDSAPNHCANFVYLSTLGFFDDLGFHRVITRFMAQGGCPLGTGTGGPGYRFPGEHPPTPKHDKPGILSMANAGPGTDGSQFFITFVPTPHLDGNHTVFGEVVEGMDVLQALEAAGSGSGRPSEKLGITKASIVVE